MMDAKEREKWEKTRAKGQFRFILSRGLLLGFGGTFISILSDYVFELFFENSLNYPHESEGFVGKVLFHLGGYLILGFILSYAWWDEKEDEFWKISEEK